MELSGPIEPQSRQIPDPGRRILEIEEAITEVHLGVEPGIRLAAPAEAEEILVPRGAAVGISVAVAGPKQHASVVEQPVAEILPRLEGIEVHIGRISMIEMEVAEGLAPTDQRREPVFGGEAGRKADASGAV